MSTETKDDHTRYKRIVKRAVADTQGLSIVGDRTKLFFIRCVCAEAF